MSAKTFDPNQMDKLFSEKRLQNLKPKKLLKNEGLKEGDIFVDIGSGNGFFSLPAAKIVGKAGKVYSVDVEIDMLLNLKHRAQKNNLADRIEICKSHNNDANLHQKADFMLFAYSLHEVEKRDKFLDNYFNFLKKGTKIVFLEWDPKERTEGPPLEERISREKLKEILKKRNIKDIKIEDLAYNSYLISGIKS